MPKIEELTPDQRTVEYAMANSEYQKRAEEFIGTVEREKQACIAMIPAVVKAMVENERIDAAQAEKLAQQLRDPVRVLEILQKTAQHRNDAELAASQTRLGKPEGGSVTIAVKTASTRKPFLGERVSEPAGSDLAFLKAMGISG